MRVLVLAVLALLTAQLPAADERVGTVQLTDPPNLIRHIRKICALGGVRQLATAAPEIARTLPTVQFFGRGRPGVPTLFVLFRGIDEKLRTAVLYPVALTKEAFVRKHRGAKLLPDGTVNVPYDENCPVCAAGSWSYVAFSRDGQWAGAGDVEDDARRALREVAVAERPMSNDVVRVEGGIAIFEAIADGRKKAGEKIEKIGFGLSETNLCGATGFSAELCVGTNGLDLAYRVNYAKTPRIAEPIKLDFAADASQNTNLLARFERLMPECKERPLAARFVGVPAFVEGMAFAAWAEGPSVRCVLRLTPEGIGSAIRSLSVGDGKSVR